MRTFLTLLSNQKNRKPLIRGENITTVADNKAEDESNSLIVKIPKQKSKEKREILKRQDQVRKKIGQI